MKAYICINCGDEWYFCPEDYKYNKSKYPTTCSLCSMPILQAFNDIREKEGFIEAIKFVLRNRLFKQRN